MVFSILNSSQISDGTQMSNSTYMNRIAVTDQVNGVCKLSEPENFQE